jgi:hypothetical protein
LLLDAASLSIRFSNAAAGSAEAMPDEQLMIASQL